MALPPRIPISSQCAFRAPSFRSHTSLAPPPPPPPPPHSPLPHGHTVRSVPSRLPSFLPSFPTSPPPSLPPSLCLRRSRIAIPSRRPRPFDRSTFTFFVGRAVGRASQVPFYFYSTQIQNGPLLASLSSLDVAVLDRPQTHSGFEKNYNFLEEKFAQQGLPCMQFPIFQPFAEVKMIVGRDEELLSDIIQIVFE